MTSMTPKEQFRTGFLLKCAEDGRSMDEIRAMVKAGGIGVGAGLGAALGLSATEALKGLGNAGKAVFNYYAASPALLAGSGILAAGGIGAAMGHAGGKLNSEDVDADELKRQELLEAYKAQASKIRQLAALKQPKETVRSPRLLH